MKQKSTIRFSQSWSSGVQVSCGRYSRIQGKKITFKNSFVMDDISTSKQGINISIWPNNPQIEIQCQGINLGLLLFFKNMNLH